MHWRVHRCDPQRISHHSDSPSSHSTGVEGNLNVDRSIQLGPSGHLRCTQNTSHSAAEGRTRISVLRVPPRSATDTVHNSSALQLNTSALVLGGLRPRPSPSPIRHGLHRLHRRLLHAVLHAVLLHVCRVKRGRCSLGDVVRGLLYYPLADGAGRGGPRQEAALCLIWRWRGVLEGAFGRRKPLWGRLHCTKPPWAAVFYMAAMLNIIGCCA